VNARKQPANRLFRGLVLFSLGIHAVLFYQLVDVYRSREVSVIELSLEDASKPETRSIPRPRPRPRKQPQDANLSRPRTDVRPLPPLKPMKADPADAEAPESLVETIPVPDLPQTAAIPSARWQPAPPVEAAGEAFDTARDYFDLVRLRIEQKKRYPEPAKERNQEGRTTVRFVITKEGRPQGVRIHRSSNNRLLDQAALQAIRDAGPFPVPPRRHFQDEVPVELTIVFELT